MSTYSQQLYPENGVWGSTSRFEPVFDHFVISADARALLSRHSKLGRNGGKATKKREQLLSSQPENTVIELAVPMGIF